MNDSNVILVLGKRGFGKSLWMKQYLKSKKRVFLFDPVKDYDDFIYETAESIIDLNEEGIFADYDNNFKIALDNPDDLDVLTSMSYLNGKNILAIEECSFCFTPREKMPGYMRSVIFLGRHREVDLIVTAQRAISIPIDMRSQATRVVTFAQHEGRDLDWMKEYFGDAIYEISDLEKLNCMDSENGTVTQYEILLPTKPQRSAI